MSGWWESSQELEGEILNLGAFLDVPPFHPGCWDALALFWFSVGSWGGAWPCFVLTPSSGGAGDRMSILPRFPQIPSPQPLHPSLRFPSFPLILVCSGGGQVAENLGSTHSLQLPSQGCPIPAQPTSAIPASFPRRIRWKNSGKYHLELGQECSRGEPC